MNFLLIKIEFLKISNLSAVIEVPSPVFLRGSGV